VANFCRRSKYCCWCCCSNEDGWPGRRCCCLCAFQRRANSGICPTLQTLFWPSDLGVAFVQSIAVSQVGALTSWLPYTIKSSGCFAPAPSYPRPPCADLFKCRHRSFQSATGSSRRFGGLQARQPLFHHHRIREMTKPPIVPLLGYAASE